MKNNPPREGLLRYICLPLLQAVIKKPLLGGEYLLLIDWIKIRTLVFLIGAVLGGALQHKLDNLSNVLFRFPATSLTNEETTELSKKDASKNLEKYESTFWHKPFTFYDYIFCQMIENIISSTNITITPREVFNAYLSGDKILKKLLDKKVESKMGGGDIIMFCLQGICFGNLFPELTQMMYQKAWDDDKEFLAKIWPQGLVIPPQLKAATIFEAEKATLLIVSTYLSDFCPELVDDLTLRDEAYYDKLPHEPSNLDIIQEIIITDRNKLVRQHIRNSSSTGSISLESNPFNPSDTALLINAYLGFPTVYPEKLETLLKKLLGTEYDNHYQSAKQRLISRINKPL